MFISKQISQEVMLVVHACHLKASKRTKLNTQAVK